MRPEHTLNKAMSKHVHPAAVGAFVVGAVILAAVAVAVFGSGRLFRTTYPYVLYFGGDVSGLNVGAPVKFKGVPVGSVRRILLSSGTMNELARRNAAVRIPVMIELDAQQVKGMGATVVPNPDTIKQLITLGMRAQLRAQSFVTGVLYVSLDMHPDTELHFVADPAVEYVEIPTLPTPLEEAEMNATRFLAKLADYDVRALLDSLAHAVSGVDRLVNSPDLRDLLAALPPAVRRIDGAAGELQNTLASVGHLADNVNGRVGLLASNLNETMRNASDALVEARGALEQVNGFLQPDAPVPYQLSQSLTDISVAARALRLLVEDMRHNPTALLRGKASSQIEQ